MKKRISLLLLDISVFLAHLALKIYEPPFIKLNTEDAIKIFGATNKPPKSKYVN